MSELCETVFEKSSDYTTDIEGLRAGLEAVYTLALEDLSWEELETLCSDTNADSITPSPLTALYPDAVIPRIGIPSGEHRDPGWLWVYAIRLALVIGPTVIFSEMADYAPDWWAIQVTERLGPP